MKRHWFLATSGAIGIAMALGSAHATPLTLQSNYLDIGISDYGTLGSDGSTSPGLLYDPTGARNYGVNDFLTPGTPHEGFSFSADQLGGPTSFISNDNDYNADGAGGYIGSFSTVSGPTATTVPGYSQAATWTGAYDLAGGGVITITNIEFMNVNSQQLNIQTTITSTVALTGAAFTRSLDPDPDVNTYGDYETLNALGNASYGADAKSAACGSGAKTDQTVCLVTSNDQSDIANASAGTHIANIDDTCCTDENPFTFLNNGAGFMPGAGTDADDSIDLTWLLGSIGANDPVTLDYAYVLGPTFESVAPPPSTTATPEASTWAMMLLGFGGLAVLGRRSSLGSAFALASR